MNLEINKKEREWLVNVLVIVKSEILTNKESKEFCDNFKNKVLNCK